MKRLACLSCGAPLSAPDPTGTFTCGHCSSTFQREQLRPDRSATHVALYLFVGVGLMLTIAVAAAAMMGLMVFKRAAPEPAPEPAPAITMTTPSYVPVTPKVARPAQKPDSVPLSRLQEMTGTFGWFNIDAPGMTGPWDNFPLMANLDWMLSVGQAWSPDLRLKRLGIDGVKPDGTLDLSTRDDRSIDARYASPSLRATALASAKVSEAEVHSEFRIELSESQLTALISAARGSERDEAPPPPPTLGCDLPELMAAFKAGGLEQRPVYDLLLQWIEMGDRPGYWRWTADSTRAGDRIKAPILDPATCKRR